MNANTAANTTRRLLHEAEKEELSLLQSSTASIATDPGMELLETLQSSLPPSPGRLLDNLSTLSVLLGHVPPASTSPSSPHLVETLAESLMDLTRQIFEAEDQLRTISDLRNELERNVVEVQEVLAVLDAEDNAHETENMQQQIAQWNRESKQIALKVTEYKERISLLEKASGGQAMLEDLRRKENILKRTKAEVSALEKNLAEFHGLPPDLEASREEVRRAQAQLDDLKRRRNDLFEEIGQD